MRGLLTFFTLLSSIAWAIPLPNLTPQTWTTHGLHVAYLKRSHLPMIDLRLVAPAGSGYDQRKGMAYMTNHMLDQGTSTLTQKDIAEQFEAVGARYSDGIGKDMAISGIRSLTQAAYFKPALSTWIKMLSDPMFPEQATALIRARMQQMETQTHETAKALAWLTFSSKLYGTHSYAHPAFQMNPDRRSITSRDLRTFYRQHYSTNQCDLIIVGDLTLNQAQKAATAIALALPSPPKKATPAILNVPLPQPGFIHIPFHSKQSTLILGQLGIDPHHKHRMDLQVGSYLLGGGMNSRLFETVRAKHGLTYAINSGFSIYQKRGAFLIQAQIKQGQSNKAHELILKTTTDFLKEGPTIEQTAQAKKQMQSDFLTAISANSGLLSALSYQVFYHQPVNHLSRYIDRLDAVTATSIKQAMQQTIRPSQWIIVDVGQS